MRKAGFLLMALLAACSSSSSTDGGTATTDGGSDAGSGSHRKIIEVSGTVQYHPVEVAWAAAHNYPLPSLDNATFNVEDAIAAQAMAPPLAHITLAASPDQKTWTFDVPNVDVTYTTLALIGSVEGGGTASNGDTLVFSGYGLGVPPFPAMTTGKQVFVVSMNFVKLLASSIPEYSDPNTGVQNLISDGFVIAQATDPTGTCGSSGVALYQVYGQGPTAMTSLAGQADGGSPAFYFNDTLTGLNPVTAPVSGGVTPVTSSSGLFVRVQAGSAASYTVMTPGATYLDPSSQEYQTHLNGSRQGTALMVFFKQQFADGGTEGGGLDSIGLADGGLTECPGIFASVDAGTADAGTDAGNVDAGSADAGSADAGTDAGP